MIFQVEEPFPGAQPQPVQRRPERQSPVRARLQRRGRAALPQPVHGAGRQPAEGEGREAEDRDGGHGGKVNNNGASDVTDV